jgi:hypothetical protein
MAPRGANVPISVLHGNEGPANKAVVAVLHRESKSVDNGGASAQGRRRPG